MRTLSIQEWSHYAYMVVSLAMLGLGFSGVIIALFYKFFKNHREKIILSSLFLFSLSIPISFYLSTKLPLNSLYIVWDWHQFIYLALCYFFYAIPFFFASIVLAIFFSKFPKRTGLVYGANLIGSGLGVAGAIILMYIIPPESYLTAVAILSCVATVSFIFGIKNKLKKSMFFLTLLAVLILLWQISPSSLPISEYKTLSYLLRTPGTKIIHRLYSPLGLIHIVEGKTIRLAPGLSLTFNGRLPPQKAITVDGDSPIPVNRFNGNFESLEFLDQKIYALGYHLIKNPKVLIIGAGGGEEILLAHYHKASNVAAVEMNTDIVKAVDDILKSFSNNPYSMPNTTAITKEARGYLEQTEERFDLIQFNSLGSFLSSASGVYAQNEDYINTVEAYSLFYKRLSKDGIFIITRWMNTPARDGIKMFATAYEALKKQGIKSPEEHLALIRNWDTTSLLLKHSQFYDTDIKTLRTFCEVRNFDVCYFPGVKQSEVNRFNVFPEPVYYQAATRTIDPHASFQFFRDYPFNVKASTDNKPYFSLFFRWKALPHLINTSGKEWLPFVEYGYLVLIATFIQTIIIGGLVILLPTGILLKSNPQKIFKPHPWFYFAAIGFSFMVLEIALIQKFILFLHHPIYSAAVVISSFLLWSGCGSLFSKN